MTTAETPSVILTELIGDAAISDGLVVGLSDIESEMLFRSGRTRTYLAGEHVFRQGEAHTGIFIIRSGLVRVYYAAPSGREITLAHWSPPNFVGGPELFGRGTHQWSGVTLEASELQLIPGNELRALATSSPTLALNLLDGLSGKARCYSLVLQMLGTRSVLERLAYLILTLAREREGTLKVDRRLSHASIATVIGSTRQWVSMALRRFRKDGSIDLDDEGRIIVRNARELEVLADAE